MAALTEQRGRRRPATVPTDALRALLTLRLLPAMAGPRMIELLRAHGGAERALRASSELRRALAAADRTALDARVEHALDIITRQDVRVIHALDPAYPDILTRLHDPPPVLFARGRLELLERPVLGIVGTRRCTRDASEFAHEIAQAVVMAGGVVVSGLALGIDGAAHHGALPDTIAVLGAGIDVVQPPSHRTLHERIGAEGLLLTEFPPGTEALPYHFPQRNRIIAALSRALLVVQAPQRSGALITCEHAVDLGIDVLAAPGPPRRAANLGSNGLIRDGAALVAEPRDVLDALGLTPRRAGTGPHAATGAHAGRGSAAGADASAEPAATADADATAGDDSAPPALAGAALAVWRASGDEPMHVDDLSARAGLPVQTALSALLELELMGLVRRHAGQRFQRI